MDDDTVSPPAGARPPSDSISPEAQSAEHDAASALSLWAAQPRAPVAHATRPSSSDSSSPEAQSESTEHDAAPVAHVVVTAASVRASIETDAPRATRPTAPPHLVFPLASSIEIPHPQQAHRVVEVVDARAAHHPRRSQRIAAADSEVSDASPPHYDLALRALTMSPLYAARHMIPRHHPPPSAVCLCATTPLLRTHPNLTASPIPLRSTNVGRTASET